MFPQTYVEDVASITKVALLHFVDANSFTLR